MKIKVDDHAWNGFEIRFLKSFGWMGFENKRFGNAFMNF